jgi:hypothetical protein
MSEKAKSGAPKKRVDPHIGATNPTAVVKMTVTLPRSVAAFLRWKAEVEGMKRDELLRRIVVNYAKGLKERDLNTPPIED